MKIGGLICRYWSWQQSLLLGAFGTHQEKVQENLAGQSPIANCPTKIHDFLFLESFYPLSLHSPLWPEIFLTKNQTRHRPREAVGGLNIVYNDYQILMSIADQNCKRPHPTCIASIIEYQSTQLFDDSSRTQQAIDREERPSHCDQKLAFKVTWKASRHGSAQSILVRPVLENMFPPKYYPVPGAWQLVGFRSFDWWPKE